MARVELTWRGEQAAARIGAAAARGLLEGGQRVRTVAVEQTPIDTGTLRRSAAVTPVGPLVVAVHFNTPYAVEQHENLDYRHPRGGNALYLHNACMSERDAVLNLIATAIRQEVGGR